MRMLRESRYLFDCLGIFTPVLLGLPIMLSSRTSKFGLIGYATISFEADGYGSGIHMWNVTKQDVTEYAKVSRLGSNDMRN